MSKSWIVKSTKAADKQAGKLGENVQLLLHLLFEDLENKGPALPDWPNYGKLHNKKAINKRHCHLRKGKPTYVCCWEVINKKTKNY